MVGVHQGQAILHALERQELAVVLHGDEAVGGGDILGGEGDGHILGCSGGQIGGCGEDGGHEGGHGIGGRGGGSGGLDGLAAHNGLVSHIAELHGSLGGLGGTHGHGVFLVHRHLGQGGGPHAVAHVGKQGGVIALGFGVEHQLVELAGIAVEGGKVEVAVVAHHQGGQGVVVVVVGGGVALGGQIAGIVLSTGVVGILRVELGVVLSAVQVGEELENAALVVDEVEELGIVGDAVGFGVLDGAAGGQTLKLHTAVVAFQHAGQIPGGAVGLSGEILGGHPQGHVGGVDQVLLAGEHGGVGQVVHGTLPLVQGLGGAEVDLLHGAAGAGGDEVGPVILGGGGHDIGVQIHVGGPVVGLLHVPGEGGGLAGAVGHDAADGHLDVGDMDGDGVHEALVQAGAGGDGGGAHAHGVNEALAVHGGHIGVVGLPIDEAVGGGPGQDVGGELVALALHDEHGVVAQAHIGDGVVHQIIVVPGVHIGDHQGGQVVEHVVVGHHGVVGLDLKEPGLAAPGAGLVADPNHIAGVGIVLHGLDAGGLEGGIVIAVQALGHLNRGGQGGGGEGADVAGVQRVGVEGALGVDGQGVGVDADGAHIGEFTGELIHLGEDGLAILGLVDAVDGVILGAVGHVVQFLGQLAHADGAHQVLFVEDIEDGVLGHSVDVGIGQGGGVEGDAALGVGGQGLIVGVHIEAHPVGGIVLGILQVLGQQLGQGNGGADLHVQLVGGHVVGVVEDLDEELLAVGVGGGQGELVGVAHVGVGDGAGGGEDLPAAAVEEGHAGDVLVILGLHGDGGALALAQLHIQDLGGGVVDADGGGEGGAVAQGIPVGLLFHHVGVVLGGQSDGGGETLTLIQAAGDEVDGETVVGVDPHGEEHHDTVVGSVVGAGEALEQHVAVHVGHLHAAGGGVADGGELIAVDLIAIGVVDGGALGVGDLLGVHGVAAQQVAVAGIAVILHLQGVVAGGGDLLAVHVDSLALTGVGGADLLAGQLLLDGAQLEHGGVGPAAVEAQDGDVVLGTGHALGVAKTLGVDEGLEVSAVGIGVVDVGLGLLGEVQGDIHLDGVAGGHQDHIVVAVGQEGVGVVGVDLAVLVDVGVLLVGDGVTLAGQVVQEGLGIGLGDVAIAVEVAVVQGGVGGDDAVVGGPGGGGLQSAGGVIHVGGHLGLVLSCGGLLVGVVLEGVLGEHIGAEGVELLGVGEVVDVEGEGVGTGALGIVAQLYLHLAVVLAVHGHEGLGGESVENAGQARTLLEDGDGLAVGVHHGIGGGHEDALGQGAVSHIGLAQVVGADVLHDQGAEACHLGGGHGGTGHHLVLVGLRDSTVDGVDVAAGGGDLGLHAQIAGDTPGGESAHGVVVVAVGHGGELAVHGDLAGVVDHAGLGLLLCGGGLDGVGGVLGDHGAGLRLPVAVQDHDGVVHHIVIDQGGDGALLHGLVGLVGEVDVTAGDHGDLALDIDALVVSGLALGGEHDEVVRGALALRVQGGELVRPVALAVHIAEAVAVIEEAGGDHAVVVHAGHGQGVGEGGGLRGGLHAHILHIEVGLIAVGVGGPGALVAGGDGHHGVGVHQGVHDVLIVQADGAAGVGTAQGQVGHIAVQHDGVLQGGHVVGVGGAVLAEDLHDDDLGVGGVAQGVDGVRSGDELLALLEIAVGGGDAGDMGAMLAGGVAVVGDGEVLVDVVDAEGGLGVDIEVVSRQVGHQLVDIQLGQDRGDLVLIQQVQRGNIVVVGLAGLLGALGVGILQGGGVEGLVVGIKTRVDDGDAGACTVVAALPGQVGAGHLGGDDHVGLGLGALDGLKRLVGLLHKHLLDAADLGDLVDLAEVHVGGDDVGGQGQVPDHIQLFVESLFNAVSDLFLLFQQLAAVAHSTAVLRDAVAVVAGSQSGVLVQNDGHTDGFILGIGGGGGFLVLLRLMQQGCGNFIVVHFLEGKGRPGIGGVGGGGHKTQNHHQRQRHGNDLFAKVHLHVDSPFCEFIFQEFPGIPK